ncbi:MAG TPA: hypothetical protein VH186_03295 [Chloroflexia bacterium]|nr:hypothetical protein [Chloroflexia bacterium]
MTLQLLPGSQERVEKNSVSGYRVSKIKGLNSRVGRSWLKPKRRASLANTRFAHPIEAEFARVLTFYRIRWQYEPHQFPLEWHPDGSIARMFSPDFYLPDFDLYAELTTQKQDLVTRKNAKLRRLRELYPEINIRLFYRKDLQRVLGRFGIPVVSQTTTPPGGLRG